MRGRLLSAFTDPVKEQEWGWGLQGEFWLFLALPALEAKPNYAESTGQRGPGPPSSQALLLLTWPRCTHGLRHSIHLDCRLQLLSGASTGWESGHLPLEVNIGLGLLGTVPQAPKPTAPG